MKENWEKLVALLTEMVDLYRVILQLSRQKSEALIAAKTQELEAITKKEELLILRVGKLEAARGKLMQQIAASYGLAVEGLTLSKMQELTEPDIAEQLGKFAAGFDSIMNELAPVNQLNTELIEQALSYVNYNINLLTHSKASNTYAPQGQGGQSPQIRKLVDRKI